MKKAASLRAALTAALPELTDNPANLSLWIEDGAIAARQTGSLGFAFSYPLRVLLRETKTDIALLALPIIRWLQVNQPDLLAGGADRAFAFETDILDNSTADVLFTLQLTESVAVTPISDGPDAGGWQVDYLPEPDPAFVDGTGLAAGTAPPLAGASVDTIVAD